MHYTDDEAQILALIASQIEKDGLTDLETLERLGDRYWIFKNDYRSAAASLTEQGLLINRATGLGLSQTVTPHADELLRERPDMYYYYYREFYPRAWASDAHSELCRRVFGRDLCQEGMTDMEALDGLLDKCKFVPGQRVLDLGCGAGGISNYVFERHGVQVTGIDNAKPAIAQARNVFADHAEHLNFLEADLNDLKLDGEFDVALAIDVLYWVADLTETVSAVLKLLKPRGQMAVVMTHSHEDGDDPGRVPPERTRFGKAAQRLGLSFETVDLTEHNYAFWKRNYQAALDLKPQFEAEGNGFIAASLIREAEEDFLPLFEQDKISRYLFHVRHP